MLNERSHSVLDEWIHEDAMHGFYCLHMSLNASTESNLETGEQIVLFRTVDFLESR